MKLPPFGLVVLALSISQIPPLVLVMLAIVVGLIVLYLIARRVKPFGQSLGFVCAVAGRLFVTLVKFMSKAATYCKSACLASLHYPPGVCDEYWSGVNVLSRLVYFVLAVLILAGETFNTLLALPSLFNTTSSMQLPGIVELASAALFICCPALLGAVILECIGLIPHGAGLFPKIGKLLRWVLGIVSGVVLVLAILVTGYFYVYRALYTLDPDSTQGMSLYILGGLGVETAAVAVLALWALVVGGAGVVSLCLWMAEKACEATSAAALFIPELLDILALHLTDGTVGVWGEQRERDPHTYPSFHIARFHGLQPGQAVLSLSHPTSVATASESGIVPIETQELESAMSHPDKNAAIVFVGSFGTKMFTPVSQKIATLRAAESILTSGYLDLSITHVHTALPGIVDLSPTHAERKEALLHSDTEGQAYNTLLNTSADRLVESHLETKSSPTPLIFIIDSRRLVDAVDMLTNIKRRLPLHRLVVVTSLSRREMQNTSVQAGIGDMQSLYEDDIVETVIVTDPHYSFATQYGEETQHTFLAHTLVSLVIGHKHHPYNLPFTDVLHELHRCSPFSALSFATEPVAVGTVPKRWAWLPGVAGHAGTGNFGDIVTQVREVINKVATQETTCTFPASVHNDATRAVLTTVPIALNDDRFAACAHDTALYVRQQYPSATSITVRGNGCPYPHQRGSKYLVSATCLYPLQPTNFPNLQSSSSVHVTPLYPAAPLEGANGNGHQPVYEQPIDTKPTTGTPTTRQKNAAASARRSGRKNKQAAQ